MSVLLESPVAAAGSRGRRAGLGRLAVARPPVRREPRGTRWWAGAAGMMVGLVLLAFFCQAAVFSVLQYQRAQILDRGLLRTALAKAEAPVGQLDVHSRPVALGTPVALLSIPAIGVDQTVLEGTTAAVLRSGPGLRRDSVMPGQAGTSVIMGRQATYGGPFGKLGQLRPGDTIRVTTGQGVAVYKVYGVRRGGEAQPTTASGVGVLQLVTGDGLAYAPSGVLQVDAALVSSVRSGSTRVMATAMLPSSERAMGSDPTGWLLAGMLTVFLVEAVAGLAWAWVHWGRRSTWVVAVPVVVFLLAAITDTILGALPNLL